MRIAYELCLATAGKQVPSGPNWIHEVKHDGYRMLVIRENDRVRLLSRNGSDWTKRYPWIAEAALKNGQQHFRHRRRGRRSVSTASPTSMRCIPASTSTKCNSMPLT